MDIFIYYNLGAPKRINHQESKVETALIRLRFETLKITTLHAFNSLKEVMGGPLCMHVVKKPPLAKHGGFPCLNPFNPTQSNNVNHVEFTFPCQDHDDSSVQDQSQKSYISLVYCVTTSTLKVKVEFISRAYSDLHGRVGGYAGLEESWGMFELFQVRSCFTKHDKEWEITWVSLPLELVVGTNRADPSENVEFQFRDLQTTDADHDRATMHRHVIVR